MQLAAPISTALPGSPIDRRPLAARVDGSLMLAAPDATGRTFVSAASGIAAGPGGSAWVVSDEYGELARFGSIMDAGALLPGLAPARKKPDLESVLVREAHAGQPGFLLALGSGNNAARSRGLYQQLDTAGQPLGAPRELDLAALYRTAASQLDGHELNIEGMALRQSRDGAELLLMHRGQRAGTQNRIFRLDAAAAFDAIHTNGTIPASAIRASHAIELGQIDGVPLGFADARALGDGSIVFAASAEREGTGPDGPIVGSVIGILDAQLQVTMLRPLTGPARKIEGIELASLLDPTASNRELVLVTDPDDPQRPTELLRVDLGTT